MAVSPGAVLRCGQGQDLGFAACTVFCSCVNFTHLLCTESGQGMMGLVLFKRLASAQPLIRTQTD